MCWGCPFSRRFGSRVPHVWGEPAKAKGTFCGQSLGLGRNPWTDGICAWGGRGPLRRRKTPCLWGVRLPGLSTQGTVSNCWKAWPAPASRCALASQVCHFRRRGTRVLVSTPAPLPPTSAFPCQSCPHTWERGTRPSAVMQAAGCGGCFRCSLYQISRSFSTLGTVPDRLRAIGSEELTAFQGIFPGSWPRLTAWLFGQCCLRVWNQLAREGGWNPTQWSGISLWGMGGEHRHVPCWDP